ncbi:MAG TPA: type II toxin-antitoxin system VapB family antitoxin [Candidatus Acidoferrum sp.]|nr:type II toxin-antitoxin system VapB family antitoxin [Candidatus Acidoferrum sp.]
MALNIKDERTDQLAREVAKRAGETLTVAIRTSLEERLRRLSGRQSASTRKEKLYEILQRVDSLPRVGDLTEDEILGYDENGIPRQR